MMNAQDEPRDWDAPAYARTAAPIEALGRAVIPRLQLRGDETVLDAGCGAGGVTSALLEALPHGRVVGVDGSQQMVDRARATLDPSRSEVRRADLLTVSFDEPFDAILSTATFHWIADHDTLFARMFEALKPGGRFAAQCGGAGNIARVRAAIDDIDEPALRGWKGPWNFATAEETKDRLERAGFTEVETWLHDAPVTPDEPEIYLPTIVLGSHLEQLAPERREPFTAAVLARLGEPVTLDYVRLNLVARRPPAAP